MEKYNIPLEKFGLEWTSRASQELLNEVKKSIQKIEKANGQLEIMERDAIMLMVKLVGGYYNIKVME
jgi:hypothetical protein